MQEYNRPLVRLRTVDQIMVELNQLDPGSNISKHFVRTLAVSHAIPVVYVGNRRLIDLDGLLSYLQCCSTNVKPEQTEQIGQIRKVQL